MSKKIPVIENKCSNYSNLICFKSKCLGNNAIDNNYSINNGLGNRNLRLHIFENLK